MEIGALGGLPSLRILCFVSRIKTSGYSVQYAKGLAGFKKDKQKKRVLFSSIIIGSYFDVFISFQISMP